MTTEKKIAVEYSLPLDLTFQILLRTPPKSVLRFKSVSKSWCSIIRSQEFIDAFMASQPRHVLLLNNHDEDRVLFFSSPHQNCSFLSSSSISFAKDNTLTMPKFKFYIDHICNSVRRFICCRIREGFVVCNPSTGQVIPLSEKNSDDYHYYRVYLGYDPKNDQYKALRLKSRMGYDLEIQHSVLTLGCQGSWRPVKADISYYSCYQSGLCVDGIVYYKCRRRDNQDKAMLSCFDVGSEQLWDIETPENLSGDLTNYLGKLAMYCSTVNGFDLWVLDDVKNQVWSKKSFEFPLLNELSMCSSSSYERVITASGEILYVPRWFSDSLELVCYNMEKEMGRRVGVKGLSDYINCSTLNNSCFYSSLLCSYLDNIICLFFYAPVKLLRSFSTHLLMMSEDGYNILWWFQPVDSHHSRAKIIRSFYQGSSWSRRYKDQHDKHASEPRRR